MPPPRVDREALLRLSPEEREEFEALIEDRYGGESLTDFIARTRPLEPPPRHLAPLIDLFERARRGRVNACVSMPPRAGKSSTIRSAIAWWLSHTPADTIGYGSYNLDLAGEQSYKARAESDGVGVELSRDHRSMDDWQTTNGGGLKAAGVETGMTGRGISGFFVVDDPYKDGSEAASATVSRRVWDWFNDVVLTRREGAASTIVVHTRWVPDDLIGRLQKEGGWEVVNIPAIAESDNDILGRKIGESFWPERPQFSVAELELIKARNPWGFASLYQGRPASRGSKLFTRPAAYFDPKESLSGWICVIGADPAATTKTSGDFSAAVVLAIKMGATVDQHRVRILHVYREQVEVPRFARDLRALQLRFHMGPVIVEAVGGFKAVPQLLREMAPQMLMRELSGSALGGDKLTRAESFAHAWNDGRVEVPMGSPAWLEPFLEEVFAFTGVNDKHDDQIDAASHGYNHVARTPVVRRGSVEVPTAYGARGKGR